MFNHTERIRLSRDEFDAQAAIQGELMSRKTAYIPPTICVFSQGKFTKGGFGGNVESNDSTGPFHS